VKPENILYETHNQPRPLLETEPGRKSMSGEGNRVSRLVGRKTGFALVAALMAIWILTAVGILVFTVSTQDLRISTRLVGEKRAFSALETGINALTRNFDYDNPAASKQEDQLADTGGSDPGARYTIAEPWIPGPEEGPAFIYYTGFSEEWGRARFLTNVTGSNTRHGSRAEAHVGLGYGPVPGGTESR
jgi:hypothetical protein